MCHFQNRHASFFNRFFYFILFKVNDSGSNEYTIFFQTCRNDRCHRNNNVCQNICNNNVIFLCSDFFLKYCIINQVSAQVVYLKILISRGNAILINICTGQMSCTKFQADDRKDSASASYVQHFIACFHIFTKLVDTKLCGLMFTGSNLVLIGLIQFFPGRFDQNIINRKGMEKLFPVIHPVDILCLAACDLAASDIYIAAHFFQCFCHFF